MDDGLPSYMTQMFESQSIQCLVYQMTTTRLCDLLDLDTRGTVVPVLPEAFILLILYGIMSGLSYLHGQRVIHNPVTCRSIYLNRDLMPILKCIDPECTPDGVIRAFFNSSRQECLPLPPEVENISNTWSLLPEKDKESCVIRISEKADIFLLGYTIINIVSRCYRNPAPNPERLYDNSGTLAYPRIIANLSPGLSSLVWDMIRSKPEDRITAETCKIRVGLLMFGPKTDEIQTMRSYQVWHQAALMRILLDREEREISEIKSSSEYSRTVKSSLRHNEAILRRDFLTSLPLTKQWDIYRVNNSVNEMET
ncbi:hypothetical protein LSH36_122g02069 [Paralvinella palmiformis]|uniref:Protein kinase domain-containing protein n=1 Tax=Paralvinella palmiformis TaxID=53620 RepID=A0AAD9JYF2_9ANNE|nr:hypothetical protein LSH36_122g02069 [Paralvinella palmiformis]